MRSNNGDRAAHETKSIIEAQIRGELPIGPAFRFAGGNAAVAGFRRGMQLDASETSELIGPARRHKKFTP